VLLLLGKLRLGDRLRDRVAAEAAGGTLDRATLSRLAGTLEREGRCAMAAVAVAVVDAEEGARIRSRCAPA
jgi:hypothetical protein